MEPLFHLSLSRSSSSAALTHGETSQRKALAGARMCCERGSGGEHLTRNIFAPMEGRTGYFLLSFTPNGEECAVPEHGWHGCTARAVVPGVAVLPPWLAEVLQHSQSCSTLASRRSWPPARPAGHRHRWAGVLVARGQQSPSSCHAAKPHKQHYQ